ncbi:hypothetical protein J6590_022878 [Homalodisca vitripennis]|nr:hypothetical protein J6590_022878 [Homalodisca vitripennis]
MSDRVDSEDHRGGKIASWSMTFWEKRFAMAENVIYVTVDRDVENLKDNRAQSNQDKHDSFSQSSNLSRKDEEKEIAYNLRYPVREFPLTTRLRFLTFSEPFLSL